MTSKPEYLNELPHAIEFLDEIQVPLTQKTYGYALGIWINFLQSDPSIQVDDLATWTEGLIADFHVWLLDHDYAISSIYLYLSALRRYLQYLSVHNELPFNLERAIYRWREVSGGQRHVAESKSRITDLRIPQIIAYYDDMELPEEEDYRSWIKRLEILRARAIVHTLYASAGQVSEVCSLTREMVQDGKLSECVITGRGGKERTLLLTPEAQQAIAAYCKERDDDYPAVFIGHGGRRRGGTITRGTAWRIVNNAATALHIEGFTSPQDFRHWRAQSLLEEGMSLDALQVYLGHRDITMTRRAYAPLVEMSAVREQVKQYGRKPKTRGLAE